MLYYTTVGYWFLFRSSKDIGLAHHFLSESNVNPRYEACVGAL